MKPAIRANYKRLRGWISIFIFPREATSVPHYDNMLTKLTQEQPWSSREEKIVIEPFTYTTSTPGKDIRRKLIDSFNLWLNVPADKLELIASIVNMLHNASLLIDDIEDDSQLRRGQPVAHKIYGVPQTINASNYVMFKACQEVSKLRDANSSSGQAVDNIVTDELMSLHRGQGLEIYWRDSLTCPSEEEYIEMVNNSEVSYVDLYQKDIDTLKKPVVSSVSR